MNNKNILVTGSSGNLGSKIVNQLKDENAQFSIYKHDEPIDDIKWEKITHIINCAAVLPDNNHSPQRYFSANVLFIENILPFIKGKHFLHFSTISIFFRFEAYQISKLIGDAILFQNREYFSTLDIVPLPALDDKILIDKIIHKINNNNQTSVDRLIYNYCSPVTVAESVVKYFLYNKKLKIPFIKKDLYKEVSKKTNKYVKPGKLINRTCFSGDIITTNSEANKSFIDLFSK